MKKCSCKGFFLERFIQPSILMILSKEKLHGYLIYNKLTESEIMDYSQTDLGGVYRTLKKMESLGLILSSWQTGEEPALPRRVYEITEDGRQCLKFWGETLLKYGNEIDRLAHAIIDNVDEG